MSTLELIASIVESAAWPIAVVVAVVIMRVKIGAALASMAGRLTSVSAAGTQINFDRKLEDVKNQVSVDLDGDTGPGREGVEPPGPVKVSESSDVDVPELDNGALPSMPWRDDELETLLALAEVLPHGAVMAAFIDIEQQVRRISHASGLMWEKRSFRKLLFELKERSLLPYTLVDSLEELEQLRNMAAHGRQGAISVELAFDYVITASKVKAQIAKIASVL